MIAKQVMGKVKAPKKEAKCRDVARYMISEDYGHMPVVDDSEKIIGIISEFDLLKAVRMGKDLDEITVGELMSPKVVTVNHDDSMDSVMDIMTKYYIVSLPVIKYDKVIGIINRRNVLHSIVDHEYIEYFMTIR